MQGMAQRLSFSSFDLCMELAGCQYSGSVPRKSTPPGYVLGRKPAPVGGTGL